MSRQCLLAFVAAVAALAQERPLEPHEIAGFPEPQPGMMTREQVERRIWNLSRLDFAIGKCEYRKHIVDYQPFIVHAMPRAHDPAAHFNARGRVQFEAINRYKNLGGQIIELHEETWAHFGRLEAADEAAFTRFVDYAHKRGLKVFVYMTGGFTLAGAAQPSARCMDDSVQRNSRSEANIGLAVHCKHHSRIHDITHPAHARQNDSRMGEAAFGAGRPHSGGRRDRQHRPGRSRRRDVPVSRTTRPVRCGAGELQLAGQEVAQRNQGDQGPMKFAISFLLAAAMAVGQERTPLPPGKIADYPEPVPGTMARDDIRRRLRNLNLMDYAVKKCEYRRHLVGYEPFIAHIMPEWADPARRFNAREKLQFAEIDRYKEMGVQIIELHAETWAHFGRYEPVDAAIFTRFIDYAHRKGIKVFVYVTGIFTSLADPPLPEDVFVYPRKFIRNPKGAAQARGKSDLPMARPWNWGCPGSPGWHEYFLNGLETIFSRYKVDGVYFDSGVALAVHCKHRSHIFDLDHSERVLDKLNRGSSKPLAEQGGSFIDHEVDLINLVASVCRKYRKGLTVYMNSPSRFGNYDQPNRLIDHRLVGEAGDTKSLRYFADINRGSTPAETDLLRNEPDSYFQRSIYQVYAWWNRNTMAPDQRFYAANIPFVQYPYLMQGVVAGGGTKEGQFTPEHENLWARYGKIYRQMTQDNTVAYVNVRQSKLFRAPLPDERVHPTFFVRENIDLALANLSGQDHPIEFTAPLIDLETGERDVRSIRLPKDGSIRFFRVQNPADLEPTPEEDPLKFTMRGIEDLVTTVDRNNLAQEGRVETSSVFKGPFGSGGSFVADTQANDGSLDTYWWQDFRIEPTKQWHYTVELREFGPIEKVQVVAREVDETKIRIQLTGESYAEWAEPKGLDVRREAAGGRVFLTYTFPAVQARYLKVQGAPEGESVRIYEIRAYRSSASSILEEKGRSLLRMAASRRGAGDIPPERNLALNKDVWTNYPGNAAAAVDGDLKTGMMAPDIWSGGGPFWMVIDLGKQMPVSAVQYRSGDSAMYRRRQQDEIGQDGGVVYDPSKDPQFQQYRIYVSGDLKSFTQVADEAENRTPPPPAGVVYEFPAQTARYVAVRVDYTSFGKGLPIQIQEVKVR